MTQWQKKGFVGARLALLAVVALAMLRFGLAAAASAAPPAGTVAGMARDAQQQGLAGATVTLEEQGKVIARTTAAADGSYSFTGLAPGSYTVHAEKSGTAGSTGVTLAAGAGASADVTLLAGAQQPTEEVTVTAQRLAAAALSIEPRIGASTYTLSNEAIQNLPGGEDLPLNQVLLQTPGVNQDNQANGAIHIRNEHLEVQYRINGIVLPEGVSFFGQGLDPRFVDSMQLITGTLPAEYGLRTAGIVDL
jgi:hypothetical protein